MNFSQIFNSSNIHHAYLLIGQPMEILPDLKEAIGQKLKSSALSADPDFWEQSYESFGIKDSLDLRERQTKKSFREGGGRYFVLTIDSITPEAQNALLKTFEEPAVDVHFFIIARSEDLFLPTLKSRFQIITTHFPPKEGNLPLGREMVKFLRMEPQERLDFVHDRFTKNPARRGGKEVGKGDIFEFLKELEITLRGEIEMNKKNLQA